MVRVPMEDMFFDTYVSRYTNREYCEKVYDEWSSGSTTEDDYLTEDDMTFEGRADVYV